MEINKELSSELDMKFVFQNGRVALTLKHDTKGIDTDITVSVDPDYFIAKLAEAFPKASPFLVPLLKIVLSSV